ncbi:MAG TPA: transcriptional repressor LexA [Streptosporangiaceae bacterium]|jgi:repressor LexA
MSSTTVDQASDGPDLDPTLTPRQRKIVRFISGWVHEHGYSPSMREIGRAVGLTSTSSVEHQLAALQAKGYLRRAAGCPRTMEVRLPGQPPATLTPGPAAARTPRRRPARSPKPAARVPLVGRIAAGAPVPAEESADEIFPLPKELVGEGELFMLKVAGDSMIGVAIADGDWVVIRQQSDAESGEIVAAMIDGEATVKTLKRSDNHVWLMPHNSAYTPILGDQATILGRVVSVLRRV